MPAEQLRGADVVVAGLGITGQSLVTGLVDLGASVWAVDSRPDVAAAADLPSEVRLSADPDWDALADQVLQDPPDVLLTSPGLPPTTPLLARARALGVPIWSEVELAWRVCPPGVDWLALTGTNGKTTTVSMLAAMLAAAGKRAPAVGNVGTPILTTVLGARGAGTGLDALAIELSSFQLHYTHTMAPLASACLNLAEDHQDWYPDLAHYGADKARIFERTTGACIYNEQDPATRTMVEQAEVADGARAVGFTLTSPRVGQVGVVGDVLADRAFTANRQTHAQELATFEDLAAFGAGQPPGHQVANALAASALALAGGVAPAHVGEGLRSLRPAAHRFAEAGRHDGVRYINDSKATNAHAALASLRALDEGRGVWIAGGLAKGADLGPLVQQIAGRLHAVVVIGVDPGPITGALDRHAPRLPRIVVPASDTEPMVTAVRHAARLATPGDVVLLAPACASQDQFASYAARGDAFVAAVAALGDTGHEVVT